MQQSNQAYLASLNSSQLEAATHGEGPALVLAGPGSGKTTVIVKRILYLIKEMQIPPEEILVVTFTKDAAMSMQQRFAQQDKQAYPVNFGTFHSIFYHIIMEAGYSPHILSQTQKKGIMTEILRQEAAKTGTYYDYDAIKAEADDFLRAIGFYKNTQDLEAAEKFLPTPKNSSPNSPQKNNFMEIFELYQRQCRIQGGLDFDDMLYECRRLLLENEAKREYWQKRFRYILIDEFQDINPLQYEVVKLLGERHGNLFAVGDDYQAIYCFRGSKHACL
ncbi:MAG: UvrD-helicase domain-containing protein, partial [Acetatifactor sp.]|nr:UvrD-helicase domain-containing protein [Acetatifactor sp.]